METNMIPYTSSSSSSSSRGTKRKYDVFVSFRGEDIRNSFADHLFGALNREGIRFVFRDDKDIKQGDHVSTELMAAIEESQVLIPVFSKNYASSSWCLDELAKIADCINREGQHVLPVFYDVSPSEVRHQSGDYFRKAFDEHEQRFKHDLGMLQRWRQALKQVSYLAGWDVQNKREYGEIKEIVRRTNDMLDKKSSSLDGLVGMYSRVEQLEKLLAIDSDNDNDVRVVGICGMGGIGKTTLATEVFRRISRKFVILCFIDDVNEGYHRGGVLHVQRQLICQVEEEKTRGIRNTVEATDLIETRLFNQKALIVLDNIDTFEQLKKLGVNRKCLPSGSRMILVSRDRHILDAYGVDEVYDSQLLDHNEAHQLFCKKAFKESHDNINKEYQLLTPHALRYCKGLPLAIEVLGSFLCARDISRWRSALDSLKDNPDREIIKVLQISFDGLGHQGKEIFLDIACDVDLNIIRSSRGSPAEIEIQVLLDKSLLRKDEYDGDIFMHDMLKELGRNIVRQQAPNEPRKWSRIWCEEDFRRLMYEKMAMDNIEVIVLSRMQSNEELRAETLSRMNRLRLLIIYHDMAFSGSLSHLSRELQYLEWNYYPFTYFPSDCELINLVELQLYSSSLKQLWEGKMHLPKLKVLDLTESRGLVRIPDLSSARNLVELILACCTNLEYIDPSIGLLVNLEYLDLFHCISLTSLPKSIFGLPSLKSLNLEGCWKAFQDSNDNNVGSTQVPSLYCLKSLNLRYCRLVNIPESVASLSCLEELYLEGNNFVTLPSFIRKLPRLRKLMLDQCKELTYLSEFPLGTCFQVDRLEEVTLRMSNCPKFVEMESLSSSAFSWMIQVLTVHKEFSPKISIVIPATQIPTWFDHQVPGYSITIKPFPKVGDTITIRPFPKAGDSIPIGRFPFRNDSITIGPFPNVHDTNWIGIAFCATFVGHGQGHQDIRIKFYHKGDFLGMGISRSVTLLVEETKEDEFGYLWLLYFTRQELTDYYMQIENIKIEKAQRDGVRFYAAGNNFCFELSSSTFRTEVHLEIKNCGARVVYKHDLE